ncbi:MAG: hypothetical protein QXH57_03725 [Sulfolobales archaeon]
MVVDYVMLVFMSFLAVIMVLWYFRKRRELIKFIKNIIDELEDVFKPADKVYEVLGYLVGFKAKYRLGKTSKALNAYASLTTVPRHSLLYYPIAKMLSRKDILTIAVEFRDGVTEDFHLVRYGSKRLEVRLRNDVQDLDRMRRRKVELRGIPYVVYYYDEGDVGLIMSELEGLNLNLIQLSVFKSKNLVYVAVEAKEGIVRPVYKLINNIYSKLSRKR